MQNIKTKEKINLVSGPLQIGKDWPGVYFTPKFLQENFRYLVDDFDENLIKEWVSKEQDVIHILERLNLLKNSKLEDKKSLLNEYSVLLKEVRFLRNGKKEDYSENKIFDKKHCLNIIKEKLGATWNYKDVGDSNFSLNLQKITPLENVSDDNYFRADSGLIEIDNNVGYFIRGDHSFGESMDLQMLEKADDKIKLYISLLNSCVS